MPMGKRCRVKNQLKMTQAKMTMHSTGIPSLKDHSLSADKQLGISGKRQAETEGLSPQQGSDLPEAQERGQSSDSDRLFPGQWPPMLPRGQARQMQTRNPFSHFQMLE